MHTFKSAHECESLEEFVQEHYRIKFNKGKRGLAVADLKWVADHKGIEYKSNITRDELFDLLEKHGVTPMYLFKNFPESMGVIHYDYIERFNVTKNEFQKLKRRNFFEVVNHDEVRMYGKYAYVPIFSAEQFFSMTREKIDEALATKVLRKQKPTA